MGYKLVSAALDAQIPESKNPNTGLVKAVLLALLDRACNETHTCYPSMNDLQKRSQVSLSSVKRSIYLLENYGYISIERRKADGKESNTSNLYLINWNNLVSRRTDPSVEENRPLGRGEPRGSVEEERKPVIKQVNQPVKEMGRRKTPKVFIDESFVITASMREWFDKQGFKFCIEEKTQRFINHHESKGNSFVKPEKAWQNWMLDTFVPKHKSKMPQPEGFETKDYGKSDNIRF